MCLNEYLFQHNFEIVSLDKIISKLCYNKYIRQYKRTVN